MFEKPDFVKGEQAQYNGFIAIYWALAAASVIYIGICEAISRYLIPPGQDFFAGYAPLATQKYNLVRILFLFVGAQILAFVLAVRNSIQNGEAPGIIRPLMAMIVSPPELTGQVLNRFFIFVLAFCEAVSIYGLVLFLMNGSRIDAYAFIFTGIALSLLFIPSNEFVARINSFREAERARSKCQACGSYIPPKAKLCGSCGKERQ
jgi:hypothetical protein